MAWVPALDDMAWKRAPTGRGSMPPQITSFEPHARPPDSFRKPRRGDLILFSQILLIRNEGRREPFSRSFDSHAVQLGWFCHHFVDHAAAAVEWPVIRAAIGKK